MPQSLVRIPLHVVFSTKDRLPNLANPQRRERLHRYMNGICHHLGAPAARINGTEDHVHLLVYHPKHARVKDVLRDLKSSSTKWYKKTFPDPEQFAWQRGYGAIAVSPSGADDVIRYIECQEEHHRTTSFKEEFRKICAEAGIQIDERYVWD